MPDQKCCTLYHPQSAGNRVARRESDGRESARGTRSPDEKSECFVPCHGLPAVHPAAGEVTLRHIPDEQMPADFLTKWLAEPKFRKSIRYVTNYHEPAEQGSSASPVAELQPQPEPP